jgi:uncharacterized protein with FMN-binding domain
VRRISYWALSTLSAVVLLFGFDASRTGSSNVATPVVSGTTAGSTSGTTSGSGSSQSSNQNAGTNGSGSHPSSSGTTKSSATTVTGHVVQTQWGPVQVQLTVSGSTITRVSVLQYPDGNSRDVELANYSLPILIQETVQSQSADIDMVSGATFTSTGYIQWLQSAIDLANL